MQLNEVIELHLLGAVDALDTGGHDARLVGGGRGGVRIVVAMGGGGGRGGCLGDGQGGDDENCEKGLVHDETTIPYPSQSPVLRRH